MVRQELPLCGPTWIKAAVKEVLLVDLCLGTRREDGLGLTRLRRERKQSHWQTQQVQSFGVGNEPDV